MFGRAGRAIRNIDLLRFDHASQNLDIVGDHAVNAARAISPAFEDV